MSKVAMFIANNSTFHECIKHVEVDCHFVRDKVLKDTIFTSYVQSSKQVSILMLCKLDQVRMAALARLLSYDSHLEITAEESSHDIMALQYVHREFLEADEANLLEEKDMHIFDSRPLRDPLNLVCCNACEKPIKASQYGAHREHCRSYNSSQEIGMEFDGGAGHKKPPKKGRKKLQALYNNHGITAWEREKSESVDGDDAVSSQLNLSDHNGTVSCLSNDGNSSNCFKRAPNFADNTRGEEICRVTNGSTYRNADGPAPLATKMHYTQGSHRLRAAIGHLYHDTISEDIGNNSDSKLVQKNLAGHSQLTNSSKWLHSSLKQNAANQKFLEQCSRRATMFQSCSTDTLLTQLVRKA